MSFIKKVGGFLGKFASPITNIIGGLFGANEARENRKAQEEFAKFGIRWRVEDAKAAGLHPLYALGAQTPSFSPVYSNVGEQVSDMGQNISRAVAAQSNPAEKEVQRLQLELLKRQIDTEGAQKGYLDSMTARNLQEANAAKTFPYVNDQDLLDRLQPGQALHSEGAMMPTGQFLSQAPTVVQPSSTDDSLVAGPGTPLWRPFRFAKGATLVLPGGIQGDAAEVLESLSESPVMLGIVYKENVERYGADFTNKMFSRYFPDFLKDADPWWRRPGAWLGGKAADIADALREKADAWHKSDRSGYELRKRR